METDMVYDKQTSDKIAELASAVLRDPRSTQTGRKLAGSALAQAHPHGGGVNPDHTSVQLAELASAVLRDPRSTATERELAGSVLAQSGPRR
jgi:hypothetical protein